MFIRVRTNSVPPCIATHALFNGSTIASVTVEQSSRETARGGDGGRGADASGAPCARPTHPRSAPAPAWRVGPSRSRSRSRRRGTRALLHYGFRRRHGRRGRGRVARVRSTGTYRATVTGAAATGRSSSASASAHGATLRARAPGRTTAAASGLGPHRAGARTGSGRPLLRRGRGRAAARRTRGVHHPQARAPAGCVHGRRGGNSLPSAAARPAATAEHQQPSSIPLGSRVALDARVTPRTAGRLQLRLVRGTACCGGSKAGARSGRGSPRTAERAAGGDHAEPEAGLRRGARDPAHRCPPARARGGVAGEAVLALERHGCARCTSRYPRSTVCTGGDRPGRARLPQGERLQAG